MSSPFAPLTAEDPAEIGGYRLIARLGEGGMGRVYLASTQSGRQLAIKVIRPEYAAHPEFRNRFRREISAVQRVQSPYTALVIDADTESATPWLATAYIPGPPLDTVVAAHGPLPLDAALTVICGTAEALAAIHAAGVVHRDLKPSNVLLASDGPRVIDFGIAKAVDATPLTATNIRIGTPAYMAPEQALGHPAGPAVDVFALGALALYAATGRPPFGEGHPQALLYRIVNEPPDLAGCPPQLRRVVEGCLAKDPAQRPGLREVIDELRSSPTQGPGWPPPAVAAAADTYTCLPALAPASPLPRLRGRKRGVVAAFSAGVAVAVAAVTVALVGVYGRQSPSQPRTRVTVTVTAPAAGSATPGASSQAAPQAGPGALLGTYKEIELTDRHELLFTDPRKGHLSIDEGEEGDFGYLTLGFNPAVVRAKKMAVLNADEPGTYQSCLNNTRYTFSPEVKEILNRRVCVYTPSAVGMVKVIREVSHLGSYIVLDLTVWQR
ncbi:hypothetical protein GCM10017673_50190 [Streptosporangium violaceochromogenes]|nr:hypothetical protein GCM10017673_50190 [Streptosporangium violaceochromogenes]